MFPNTDLDNYRQTNNLSQVMCNEEAEIILLNSKVWYFKNAQLGVLLSTGC